MASANTLFKKLLNVKNTVIDSENTFTDGAGVTHLRISAHPKYRHQNRCPLCGKCCPKYDRPTKKPKVWRGLDWGGILVEIECPTHRVQCSKHGVVTADIPWAYPGSNFTKEFDLTVAWLAKYLPRSAVSAYMRIDWETVGNCMTRALHDLEPKLARRLDNLVHIGIDETSYRKGHKYITVIVNHDTNEVVWAANGHGKGVLQQFYQNLTEAQKASIQVVTGDGARWITECVEEYTPNCIRCIDPFHVVEWATEALDKVRIARWHAAAETAKNLVKDHPQKRGRPSADNNDATNIKKAREKADEIKDSCYTLGKAPEHLTEKQVARLQMIRANDPALYRAYCLKESLRLMLKSTSVSQAEENLKQWLWRASHSRIPEFKELYAKIKRHKDHILNTIRYNLSNARIEATNNKIKLVIRKAYGFRNIQNMLNMVYLVCSNTVIPLPNRKSAS